MEKDYIILFSPEVSGIHFSSATRRKNNQYGNSINDLKRMIKRREVFLNKFGTIFGSTGEANLISLYIKIEAMHALIERGIDPSKLIPGTGLPSIEETIKLKGST